MGNQIAPHGKSSIVSNSFVLLVVLLRDPMRSGYIIPRAAAAVRSICACIPAPTMYIRPTSTLPIDGPSRSLLARSMVVHTLHT